MIALSAPERAGWLRSRQLNAWVIDQLRLQPYQHVLEIGARTGRLLEEVAGILRIGFLAGIESSPPHYQQAYRRNKRFIARQLVQLHLGDLQDLPYPPHYFHTVYSTSGIPPGKDPIVELRRLARMLRSGGRLTLLFHPETYPVDRIQQEYTAAGLHPIQIEHREQAFGSAIAATGFTD